jgi:hypothetical protein
MNSDNPTFRTEAEERRAEEYVKMTQRVSQLEGELAIEKQTSAYRMDALQCARTIGNRYKAALEAMDCECGFTFICRRCQALAPTDKGEI